MENMELDMVREHEEDPVQRLPGLQAEVNQMKAMIKENERLIAEGDDVEGRTSLKEHLEAEVLVKSLEIKRIKKQIEAELAED